MTVLIIGANPIGLILAHQLIYHNISVRIIDHRKNIYDSTDEHVLLSHANITILKSMELLKNFDFPHKIIKGFSFHRNKTSVQSNLQENEENTYALLTNKHDLEQYLLTCLHDRQIQVEWDTFPITFVDDKLFIETVIPNKEVGNRKAVSPKWIVSCQTLPNSPILDLIKCINKPKKPISYFVSSSFFLETLSLDHIHNISVPTSSPVYLFPSVNRGFQSEFSAVSLNRPLSLKQKNYLSYKFQLSQDIETKNAFSYAPINLPLQYKNIFFVGHDFSNYYYLFPLSINLHIQAALNLSWKILLALNQVASNSLVLTYEQEIDPALQVLSQKIKSQVKQTFIMQKWFPYLLYWKLKFSLFKKTETHLFNKFRLQYPKTILVKENHKNKQWEGPQCGSLAPNYLLEENRFLLDPIKGKKHLLLFFEDNPKLISVLYEEYDYWIEIAVIKNKYVAELYHASETSLYIIRPDYIIGYRSFCFTVKDIVSYLIRIFKNESVNEKEELSSKALLAN